LNELTSFSGAHSSSLQSESEEALTMNMHELLLLIFCCFKENFLVEKAHVLVVMVACNAQAIIV